MSLAEVFGNSYGLGLDASRRGDATTPELEAALQRLCETGQQAWPDLTLPFETFVRHVAERLPRDIADPLAALAAVHAGDLFLACACVTGDPKALAIFERDFLAHVSRYLASRNFLPALRDDVKQIMSEELLLAGDSLLPRIAGYGGQAPLGSWLRVVAFRMAARLHVATQRERAAAIDATSLAIDTTAADADLAVLRSQCREEFREAFAAALADLEPRERNVIRFHHLEGLTGDVIAATYGVSRRTVHRWLEDARQKIVAGTRKRLAERLDLPARDLESLMRALQTELSSVIGASLDPADDR